jgi:hypothetical protein
MNTHEFDEKISFAYDRPHHLCVKGIQLKRRIPGYFDQEGRFVGLKPAHIMSDPARYPVYTWIDHD